MTKKVKNLIDKIASREILERAATDAYDALDDKNIWYAKKFVRERAKSIDAVQNMILLGYYPTKEYVPRIHHAVDKDREIFPLHFDPWSILFHAVKIVLEPIVEKRLIYDSSAGRRKKGQTFGALRTKMFVRRYAKKYPYFCKSDLRKFYQSIPHKLVIDTLREFIDDELFINLIQETMLDYESGILPILKEEHEKKVASCSWAADSEPMEFEGGRGVTIGSCISQIIGNLVLARIDRVMKERHRVKCYHRHCDDILMMAKTKEEAAALLTILDEEMNKMGLVVKASSFFGYLKDEKGKVNGRAIDYVGYVFTRHNMRMRKRTKKRAARAFHRVKSCKRRRELIAAYWGIAKWGKCKNLWRVITKTNNMSFAEIGIKTEPVSRDDNGKRIFNVQEESAKRMIGRDIVIYDFEDGLVIKGKPGRCAILFREAADGEDVRKKFILSAKRVIDKLQRARLAEQGGQQGVFPRPTKLIRVELNNGMTTYDLE